MGKLKYIVLFVLSTFLTSCTKEVDSEDILNNYFKALNTKNFQAFKALIHPTIFDENFMTEADFIEGLENRYISNDTHYEGLEIINEYSDTTAFGDLYLILAYKIDETHSFVKNSSMGYFYRNLQNGAIGQEVDQQSISVDGEARKISFSNTNFSLIVKNKGEDQFLLVPVCRRRIFESVLGVEEGGKAFNEYNDYYKLIIKPGL